MKEKDFIIASNIARLNVAISIVRAIYPDKVIFTEGEHSEIVEKLQSIYEKFISYSNKNRKK